MVTRRVMLLVPALVLAMSACSGGTSSSEGAAAQEPAVPSVSTEPTSTPTPAASAMADPVASASPAIECEGTLVEQTEGPYYTPGAPQRTDLVEASTVGRPLTLTGRVLDAGCQPVAGAVLDFWQADGAGVYDNEGFGLRGTQVTSDDGGYVLSTVIPGLYPSRTEHIHVKVTGADGAVHTTQLYFPDVPQNDSDGIFDDEMLVSVTEQSDDGMTATFDFVLP